MTKKLPIIRQGDVLLSPVKSLPAGCTEVPLDKGRIVLAYGEVTGHAHAIEDRAMRQIASEAAAEIAEAAVARARLLQAPNGERFLQVSEGAHCCEAVKPAVLIGETATAFLMQCRLGQVWFAKNIYSRDGTAIAGPDFQLLRHEEHSYHATPPGIYKLPVQVEYTPAELRRVED